MVLETIKKVRAYQVPSKKLHLAYALLTEHTGTANRMMLAASKCKPGVESFSGPEVCQAVLLGTVTQAKSKTHCVLTQRTSCVRGHSVWHAP